MKAKRSTKAETTHINALLRGEVSTYGRAVGWKITEKGTVFFSKAVCGVIAATPFVGGYLPAEGDAIDRRARLSLEFLDKASDNQPVFCGKDVRNIYDKACATSRRAKSSESAGIIKVGKKRINAWYIRKAIEALGGSDKVNITEAMQADVIPAILISSETGKILIAGMVK